MINIENITPIKRRFLESIGIISIEDIPNSFYDKIENLNNNITNSQKFCISDYNISPNRHNQFEIKDLVGTDHSGYAGKSWIEAFLSLERGDKNLELYFDNPNYYMEFHDDSLLGLAKKDGKYYILDSAGGGNNRLIILKLKYLALVNQGKVEEADNMKLFGNIRTVPSIISADNIFNLIFPDGGYQESGYYVINKSTFSDEKYDIVIDYPFNTKVIASDIIGSDINKLDFSNQKNAIK